MTREQMRQMDDEQFLKYYAGLGHNPNEFEAELHRRFRRLHENNQAQQEGAKPQEK